MVNQAGKLHNYPQARKSYSCSRKGIGGRKPKEKSAAKEKPLRLRSEIMHNYFHKKKSGNLTFSKNIQILIYILALHEIS